MLGIIGWIFYGLIVGLLAKFLHPPEDDPVGLLPTIAIGIAGSFVGGGLNWLLGFGSSFEPAGVIMGTVGGVVFLAAYRWWKLNKNG